MYAGIDIGTSGVKVIIADGTDNILASANYRLNVQRPRLHWCEQHPSQWWEGVKICFDSLADSHADLLHQVLGIGLSGQMLGPVLIDKSDQPIRSTILWNDGRADQETSELIAAMPDIGYRTGCNPNPGFVAPKMLWLRKHEPEIISKIDCILLPKDYVRLQLIGERGTEPTDACGTHFMEARTSRWALDLVELSGVNPDWLPPVFLPTDAGGYLKPELALKWGVSRNTVVAMGAGDNMAGSIGVGVGSPGDAVISIGTSAVNSIVSAEYNPLPDKAVITHPHAVPNTFLSMGVVLSATSCLDWAAALTSRTVPDLVRAAETVWQKGRTKDAPIFLPYVNGIRSPHDMPKARGLMLGLGLETDPDMLGWSVLEGVAFHITDSFAAQRNAGIDVAHLQLIGGGSRSHLWGEMIATMNDLPMYLPVGREVGASLGAARLAHVASGHSNPLKILCSKSRYEKKIIPNPAMAPLLKERYQRFQNAFELTRHIL